MTNLVINTLAIALLVFHTRLIGHAASAAAESTVLVADLRGLRIKLVATAGAALAALLVATTLAVYKPKGMTPYGKRKQPRQRKANRKAATPQTPTDLANGRTVPGRRAAVTVAIAVSGMIILLAVVLHVVGAGHGSHGH